MSAAPDADASERESLKVAEAARETEWGKANFLKELVLGRFRFDLIDPFPTNREDRPEFAAFLGALRELLKNDVDSEAIDRLGEYPPELVDALRKLGAFGMKIPKEYGGLGFTQSEYSRVMELVGSIDGSLTALLSAHQSIGVPQPLKMFGTDAQKKAYLPRLAKGELSAFALTEPGVGSDPARMATTVTPTADGKGWTLNGEKLWCTNGTLAEIIVVMARHADSNKISAFVVEMKSPGVSVAHRCRFMGLRAISNAVIAFENVFVPKDALIGQEGRGLKIALVTLNTGRLSLPAGAVGTAKTCLEICRNWAADRAQWGHPVGKHEAIAHKLADMAARVFAMGAMSDLASAMADRPGYDIRLEAAAAKEWNTAQGWRVADDTMQIRGGRGYETEESLRDRGERPVPVERIMRDFRINLIFEGSSEIMHLFMAREAVDKHLQVAGALVDPEQPLGKKLAALPKIVAFYAAWYPSRWLGWGRWPRFAEFGRLATHLRFVDRTSRRLARAVFHGMIVHGPKLQHRQAFLFRLVDVAMELLAMAASVSRARQMERDRDAEAARAVELADLFCRSSRRKIRTLFRDLWSNEDVAKSRVARRVLERELAWLEEGALGLDLAPGDLTPPVESSPARARETASVSG